MKTRVLVLGSSGMAGHVISLRLREATRTEVFDVGPRKEVFESTLLVDLKDRTAIEKVVADHDPDFLVNCIGVLRQESEARKADAVWFNSYLPCFLSELCDSGSRKLIHLSTDCVFSGKNGPYRENDQKDGSEFYDRTKSLGEIDNGRDLTIRTSIAGPELNPHGVGLFNWFMGQEGRVKGYARVSWSGVLTPQLADFICHIIAEQPDLSGIIHYAVPGGISKYDLLSLFKTVFQRDVDIEPTLEPVIDKRLLDTRGDFGCPPRHYREQADDMKRWVEAHGALYPHYGAR